MRNLLWLALAAFIVRFSPADPVSQGGTDWRDEAWDIYDEIASGPADDDMLPRSAP